MKKRKTNHEKIMDAWRKGHVLTTLTCAKMLGITNLPSEVGEMVFKFKSDEPDNWCWVLKNTPSGFKDDLVKHKKITINGKRYNAYWMPYYVKQSQLRKYGI